MLERIMRLLRHCAVAAASTASAAASAATSAGGWQLSGAAAAAAVGGVEPNAQSLILYRRFLAQTQLTAVLTAHASCLVSCHVMCVSFLPLTALAVCCVLGCGLLCCAVP